MNVSEITFFHTYLLNCLCCYWLNWVVPFISFIFLFNPVSGLGFGPGKVRPKMAPIQAWLQRNCNRRATCHFEHFPPECGAGMRCTVINPVSHQEELSPWTSPTKNSPRKIFHKPFERRNESSVTDVCQRQSNLFLSPVSSADGDAGQHLKHVALLHQTWVRLKLTNLIINNDEIINDNKNTCRKDRLFFCLTGTWLSGNVQTQFAEQREMRVLHMFTFCSLGCCLFCHKSHLYAISSPEWKITTEHNFM